MNSRDLGFRRLVVALALVGLLLVLPWAVGCGGGDGDGASPVAPAGAPSSPFSSPALDVTTRPITTEVAYSTLVPSSATIGVATDVAMRVSIRSADGYTLGLPDDPLFANVTSGSVLVFPATPQFPEGLARTVLSVATGAGGIREVQTRTAKLNELFKEGEFGISDIIQEEEIVSFWTAPEYDPADQGATPTVSIRGGSMRSPVFTKSPDSPLRPALSRNPRFRPLIRRSNRWDAPAGFRPALRPVFRAGEGLHIEINRVLIDQDYNLRTTNDQFKVQSKVVFDPRLNIGATIREWDVKHFIFKVTLHSEIVLAVAADIEASYEKSVQLGEIELDRRVICTIAGIPIWVKPKIPISLNVSATAHPPLYTAFSHTLDTTVGCVYRPSGWEWLRDFTQKYTYEPNDPESSLEIRVGVQPELVLLVMDIIGPKLGIELYGLVDVSPLRDPALELFMGLAGTLGIEFSIADWDIFDGSWEVFDWRKSLYKLPGPLVRIPYEPPGDGLIVLSPSGIPPVTSSTASSAPALIPDPTNIDLGGGVNMRMERIGADSFLMGGMVEPNSHQVLISRPFWMGRTEVTQAQYQAVMAVNPSAFKATTTAGLAEQPVQNVSWYDAISFCNTLSYKLGLRSAYRITDGRVTCDWSANGFRLPTEAEWELAARESRTDEQLQAAGTAQWSAIAWFWDNANRPDSNFFGKGPMPVARKAPNSNNLYDMRGNMAEWCWDFHAPYRNVNETDPVGPETGSHRIIRGGSWDARTGDRSFLYRTKRNYSGPTSRNFGTGLRVVRKVD